jgi:hypothetical protein
MFDDLGFSFPEYKVGQKYVEQRLELNDGERESWACLE